MLESAKIVGCLSSCITRIEQNTDALYDALDELVTEAKDGQTAVELARELKPDVVLMDILMPGVNGIDATRIITAELPETRVIGLSMHDEKDMAAGIIEAGAQAYLSKGGPVQNLIAAIRGER